MRRFAAGVGGAVAIDVVGMEVELADAARLPCAAAPGATPLLLATNPGSSISWPPMAEVVAAAAAAAAALLARSCLDWTTLKWVSSSDHLISSLPTAPDPAPVATTLLRPD